MLIISLHCLSEKKKKRERKQDTKNRIARIIAAKEQ